MYAGHCLVAHLVVAKHLDADSVVVNYVLCQALGLCAWWDELGKILHCVLVGGVGQLGVVNRVGL